MDQLMGSTVADEHAIYVGVSWSSLSPEGKERMRANVRAIVPVIEKHDMKAFVSLLAYPPGRRQGRGAELLSRQLRGEMAICPVFLFVYAGPSDGLTKELQNATDFGIPTLMLVEEGILLNEMSWSAFLPRLGLLRYTGHDHAAEQLDAFLTSHRSDLHQARVRLNRARELSQSVQIDVTIRRVRERAEMSQEDLANASGLPLSEIKALESNSDACNPPLRKLCAVVAALGIDLSQLFLSEHRWQTLDWQLMATRFAYQQQWPADHLFDYLGETRMQTSTRPWDRVTDDDVIEEMNLYRQLKGF